MSASPDPILVAARARVGQALNAKWTIDSLLGVGGMATVYEATHRNGTRGALKVLHEDVAADRGVRDRFLREGKIANLVDHPARVAVTDDDVSDKGEPFLVMELLVGETLSQRLRAAGKRLPLNDALSIFDTVLDLLVACHAKGILHRDIKPGNIFLTQTGVRVLDFGVARLREQGDDDRTRAGTALGTPSFMAPEQALGQQDLDGRADVFSVGACLFTCLSGKRLHAAASPTEAFLKSASQAAPSFARVAPDMPVEVVALIDRALAFDRAERFSGALAMRNELRVVLERSLTGRLGTEAPKAVGIQVRGVVDDELQAEAEKPEKVRERLASVFHGLTYAIQAVRQYGWMHPMTTRAIAQGHDEVTAALSKHPEGVRWEVQPTAFSYDGTVVFSADKPPLDRIPYALFSDGIRRIQLKPGLPVEELHDFIAIITRDGTAGASEDDAVTALWDRRFEHITYVAVESFTGGASEDSELVADALAAETSALAKLDRDFSYSLEARALEASLARGAALDELRDAAVALSVDAMTRATLAAQLDVGEELMRERFADLFVDAWREAVRGGDLGPLTDAIRDWSRHQVSLHAHASVQQMQASLNAAFARVAEPQVAQALEQKLMTLFMPAEGVQALLGDLARKPGEVEEDLLRSVARALGSLPSDEAYAATLACVEASEDERLRQPLLAYLNQWLPGHEGEVAELAARAAAPLAVQLVRVLSAHPGPNLARALEQAFDSPHVDVRLEALARWPEDANAERLRIELGRLLDDPDPALRTRVLKLVGHSGFVAAGPVLVLRVQTPTYHALPVDERRLLLESVWRLNPRRGEALALELLSGGGLLRDKAADESRVIAAETLGKAGSAAALGPLGEAAKGGFLRGPSAVRDAAARAVAAIQERAARKAKEAK